MTNTGNGSIEAAAPSSVPTWQQTGTNSPTKARAANSATFITAICNKNQESISKLLVGDSWFLGFKVSKIQKV